MLLGDNRGVHNVACPAHELQWLPFWPASAKPNRSSRRLISRKGCGLRRPNLDLNRSDSRRSRRVRRLKVKLQSLLKIGQSLLFSLPLAGYIHFQTLGNVPLPSRHTVAANGRVMSSFLHTTTAPAPPRYAPPQPRLRFRTRHSRKQEHHNPQNIYNLPLRQGGVSRPAA